MRVLLVQPVPPRSHFPRGSFLSRWVPTGLASVAKALLRAGHEVKAHVREEQLAKANLERDAADRRLRDLLAEFRPEMVGLSATTPVIPECETIARLGKETCGGQTLVVVGGPHPTALPELTLADCPSVDAVVIGEGEATAVELAERGVADDVAGLCFRRDAEAVRTRARAVPEDLDALGPPPYELFDMGFYTARDRWLVPWLPLRAMNLRTSRGCPNRCRFCAGHLVGGPGVRFHSVDYVVDQMRQAAERFGVEAVRFEDDTLGASRERLLALCEAVRRADLHRRLKWCGCLRADQPDPEVLREMKSAGCVQVEYGFESGSDTMLRRLSKNASVELNARAARLAREAGLRVFADVMFGLPGETEADFRATLRFLRRTRPEVISFARLYPIPGTAIYRDLPDQVRRSLQWADFAYFDDPHFPVNLTAMTPERFARLYREADLHCLRPALHWQLFRDTPRGDPRRRELWRRVARFCLLHPIRALRVPWRARAHPARPASPLLQPDRKPLE